MVSQTYVYVYSPVGFWYIIEEIIYWDWEKSMTEEQSKKLDSLMGTLKGTIIQNVEQTDIEKFISWCNKLVLDGNKDKQEKKLLRQIKNEQNNEKLVQLNNQKKKYLPRNYPSEIKIGDIVHINFGYGYCSEISDGHYGIVLSNLKANMYFVIPCSSEPLRIMETPIKLHVPNKEHNDDKISYLRFDQMRMIHYRRIERVSGKRMYNIGEYNILRVYKKINEFFNFSIDTFPIE